MKHKTTKKLETNRLILRPFTRNDAVAMYQNWANDSEVTQYLTWTPHEDVKATQEILESWINQYQNLGYYQWAIVLKEESDEPIGSIGVVEKRDSIQSVSIGYCIGQKWWRKGITSEALAALVKFFFEEVKVNRIVASHLSENSNSGKVMEKCGFKYEGTMRAATLTNQGDRADSVIYGILAEDHSISNDKIEGK